MLNVEVTIPDGGEADKGVVHTVQVRPPTFHRVEDSGGNNDEDGDSGGTKEEHLEEGPLAFADADDLKPLKLDGKKMTSGYNNLSHFEYPCI